MAGELNMNILHWWNDIHRENKEIEETPFPVPLCPP
jgi:hypothetical protein